MSVLRVEVPVCREAEHELCAVELLSAELLGHTHSVRSEPHGHEREEVPVIVRRYHRDVDLDVLGRVIAEHLRKIAEMLGYMVFYRLCLVWRIYNKIRVEAVIHLIHR